MARKWSKKRPSEKAAQNAFDNETGPQETSDEEEARAPSPASATWSGWWCFGRRARQPADMKKFGFGKKSGGDDDDSNRAGLFGRKKPAAKEDNPYAQQPAEDPYARMTPYQQARANLAAGPQAPRPGAAGLPSGSRPGAGGLPSGPGPAQRNAYGTPPPSYQGSPQVGGGYAPEKFGAAGGYGGNRYDSGSSTYGSAGATSGLPSQRPTRGPGGYGGLGPTDEEAVRDELLGGARQRPAAPPSYVSTDDNSADAYGATGGSYGGGYGEQRELTAEELEQEEYRRIKNQIQDVRDQSVNSSANALRLLENSINVGTGTLVRVAAQGDSLAKTEQNLDHAEQLQRVAAEKASQLVQYNRSFLIPVASNPFTSKTRQAKNEQKLLEQHRLDAAQREATRKSAFEGTQRMEKTFRDLSRPALLGQTSRSAAERSKYEVEDDSDDEGAAKAREGEEMVGRNLTEIEQLLPQAKAIAQAMSVEMDRQNEGIGRVGDKSDNVGYGLLGTRAKLNSIH